METSYRAHCSVILAQYAGNVQMRYTFRTNELKDKKGTHMKRSNVTQRVLPLALSALAISPIAATWTSDSASAASVKVAKSHTYKGPVEAVDHGPVQVSIVVTNNVVHPHKVGPFYQRVLNHLLRPILPRFCSKHQL